MPVGIVEVVNNTGKILYYHNEESGHAFIVQPTTLEYATKGWTSASKFKDDTVPYKSSGKKISVTVQDGGPHFAMWDESYHFYVFETSKPEQWTASFGNGSQFVMKVDSDAVTFIKYESILRSNDNGYIVVGGHSAVANALANDEYKVEL